MDWNAAAPWLIWTKYGLKLIWTVNHWRNIYIVKNYVSFIIFSQYQFPISTAHDEQCFGTKSFWTVASINIVSHIGGWHLSGVFSQSSEHVCYRLFFT
jgi:hypothetical protein